MNASSAPAAAEDRQRSWQSLPWPMIGATVAMLAFAFALQLAAFGHGAGTAISDLPRVLLHRGIGPGSLPYVDHAIEYPAGAGILLYLATLIAHGPLGALADHRARIDGAVRPDHRRARAAVRPAAWRWAIGAPVFLYAFQNWDVFAVAAARRATSRTSSGRMVGPG